MRMKMNMMLIIYFNLDSRGEIEIREKGISQKNVIIDFR